MGIFDKNNKRVYLRRKSLKLQNYTIVAFGFMFVSIACYIYYERSFDINPANTKSLVSEFN